ncbi:MAG: ATP-binding cassette domain-containing protein [Chloroflexi bacterium]|nr:ATP-binding cassette domain-containing protein [Chloroflexota bacterium]
MLSRLFGRTKKTNRSDGAYRHGNEHLIEMRQVVKNFETAAGTFTALKNVDLKVDPGEFVAVIGKSGSGKSTLINMIAGIDRPTSGQVFVGDTAVHLLNENQMAIWRGRHLGIVFQFFQLLPTLSIVENVMLPMDFCNVHAARERRDRALPWLEPVEMKDHAGKLPSAVSGGQQQRVAIARALANDPPVIVADEPTGNLDSKTADAVFELFDGLVRQGKTILMVTHDNDLTKRVSRAVMISDGQVIEEYLAAVFPTLEEGQLVEATRRLEPIRYAPGDVILREGTPADRFYIIMKGQVDVLVRRPSGEPLVVTTLDKGQYFGEIELMRGGHNIATIRAALASEVEVATLDRDTFANVIGQSAKTRALVERTVQDRVQENASARNGAGNA